MNHKIKIGVFCLAVLFGKSSYGQTKADTTAMVKEFTRVMAFADQPYLSFKTVTKMDAVPVMQAQDTLSYQGTFFKNQSDFYYNNGQEEIYVQDSFMIQINQNRKSIWISKVDMASKKKNNVLHVDDKQLQEFFRKEYTIEKTKINPMTSGLNFVAKQKSDAQTITTNIKLEYTLKDYLPVLMQIEMNMQQPLNDQLLAEIKNENADSSGLIQTIENVKYVVRRQKISVAFSDITNTKVRAMQMPSWKDILSYDETAHEFSAKELYKDYEITKTF